MTLQARQELQNTVLNTRRVEFGVGGWVGGGGGSMLKNVFGKVSEAYAANLRKQRFLKKRCGSGLGKAVLVFCQDGLFHFTVATVAVAHVGAIGTAFLCLCL